MDFKNFADVSNNRRMKFLVLLKILIAKLKIMKSFYSTTLIKYFKFSSRSLLQREIEKRKISTKKPEGRGQNLKSMTF